MSSPQRSRLVRRLALLAALIVALAAPGPVSRPAFAAALTTPSVRVLVLEHTRSVRVTMQGPCLVASLSKPIPTRVLDAVRWQEVRPSPQGLQVGRAVFATDRLRLAPTQHPTLLLNGTSYRGALLIVRRDDHQLLVVNEVPLEEYLKGVVPREVDARWPTETLKAQAIVARTFTLQQIADRAGQAFDVTPKWPQLYGGPSDERPRSSEAVEATRGLVVTAGGRLLITYYHTVCGGRTEDADAVWPMVKSPSLSSVECLFCRGAPHGRWTAVVSDEELTAALAPQGVAVGPISDIQAGLRNRSGRVTTVTVIGPGGSTTVSALSLRAALGPNRVRSTNFTVRSDDGRWPEGRGTASTGRSRWVFEGIGWGHGVGLCQWGAARLGQRRFTAQQILEFYYPGAEIVSWPRS